MNSREKIIYLAGILDGEGHIDRRAFKNGRGKAYIYSRISVMQKDMRICNWLKENFEGTITNNHNQTGNCHRWEIKGSQAIELIRKVYPYLLIKREQADKALQNE